LRDGELLELAVPPDHMMGVDTVAEGSFTVTLKKAD
jgi:hypothetical protein